MNGEAGKARAMEREALDEALARMEGKNGPVDEEAVDAIRTRLRPTAEDGDEPG